MPDDELIFKREVADYIHFGFFSFSLYLSILIITGIDGIIELSVSPILAPFRVPDVYPIRVFLVFRVHLFLANIAICYL